MVSVGSNPAADRNVCVIFFCADFFTFFFLISAKGVSINYVDAFKSAPTPFLDLWPHAWNKLAYSATTKDLDYQGGLEVLSGSIFLLQEYAYERRILVPLISFEGPFRKWIECGMQQKPSHILTVVLQNWEKIYCNEEKTVFCSTNTLYHFFLLILGHYSSRKWLAN